MVTKIHKSHVLIIGLGGVGSWVAEALARPGVGKLTIVDPDSVCVSNINRQLIAVDSTKVSKVEAMKKESLILILYVRLKLLKTFFVMIQRKKYLIKHEGFAFDGIDRLKNKILFYFASPRKIFLF